MFTAEKTNNLLRWWTKVELQAENGGQEPMLFFKYNRSKIFVVTRIKPEKCLKYFFISWLNCYIIIAEEWLEQEEIEFLGTY